VEAELLAGCEKSRQASGFIAEKGCGGLGVKSSGLTATGVVVSRMQTTVGCTKAIL
jgi:hypothetical protein